MNSCKLLILPMVAISGFGQYAGRAVLARGEAPQGMAVPQVSFRPFVELRAGYEAGIGGVSLTDQGSLAPPNSASGSVACGVSGLHSWKHVSVGIDYRGSLLHYTTASRFDSFNESLLLSVSDQVTRHTKLVLRTNAGYFFRDFGLLNLPQAVPFDPSTSHIPTAEFFDNRTYLTTQADYIIQKTARLSFDLGGDGFPVKRRSKALASATASAARSDFAYRLTRRSTAGAMYRFQEFTFSRGLGDIAIHRAAFMRVESKSIQVTPIDPVIAVIGNVPTSQIIHSIHYSPNFSLRVSDTFRKGVGYVAGGGTITPGNGLFLTTVATELRGGYFYTGLRQWTFSTADLFTSTTAWSPKRKLVWDSRPETFRCVYGKPPRRPFCSGRSGRRHVTWTATKPAPCPGICHYGEDGIYDGQITFRYTEIPESMV